MNSKQIILISLGAAGTVTGSKHLLKTPELLILVDCGLFQGLKNLRQKNWARLPVNASQIDVLLLTHAHLDHCGYIPLLVKNGFRGKIYMTPPTAKLTALILRDSAKIQEEDADKANKGKYSKHTKALPLYTNSDVDIALSFFNLVDDKVATKLSQDLDFKFIKNGHILGSASIIINCYGRNIVFSGDIGRYNSSLQMPPEDIKIGDYVIMESTYGDKLHGYENAEDQLCNIINRTIERKGNILIPSFAVERAQEIMHMVSQLKQNERIPTDLPVYLDSPMAASATELFHEFPEWHTLNEIECARMFLNVIINKDFHNTRKIIDTAGSKVVISSSGMLTGGRVLEYLKNYIVDPNNTILLVGYQAEGTRGKLLQNRSPEVKIHGLFFPILAEIAEITSFSGHADQGELLRWLRGFKKIPLKIFLVHGEPDALNALRIKVKAELNIEPQILEENKETVLFDI